MTWNRRYFINTGLLGTVGLLCGGSPSLLAAPPPPEQGEKTYTVKKGDTLSRIAKQHGISVAQIKQRNALKTDRILIGQKLTIPSQTAPLPPPTLSALRNTLPGGDLSAVIAATQRLRINRQRWRYIVLHHSGIERGNAKTYDAEHRRRGMENGLAYHFVIGNGRDSPEGFIEVGPRWLQQLRGGHVRKSEVNDSGIGICLVGNFENRAPSAKQLSAAFGLIDWLRESQVASTHTVTVHRWVDRNHTVCPGKHFPFAALKARYHLA